MEQKPNSQTPDFSCTDGKDFYDTRLTKREYFTAMAMQGILNNYSLNSISENYSINKIANRAIYMADEVLKQLESK